MVNSILREIESMGWKVVQGDKTKMIAKDFILEDGTPVKVVYYGDIVFVQRNSDGGILQEIPVETSEDLLQNLKGFNTHDLSSIEDVFNLYYFFIDFAQDSFVPEVDAIIDSDEFISDDDYDDDDDDDYDDDDDEIIGDFEVHGWDDCNS